MIRFILSEKNRFPCYCETFAVQRNEWRDESQRQFYTVVVSSIWLSIHGKEEFFFLRWSVVINYSAILITVTSQH